MPENVLMKMNPTRLAFIKSYIGAAVLIAIWFVLYTGSIKILKLPDLYRSYTFAALILAAALTAIAEIRTRLETYVLTDYRITERTGLLSVHESSVSWDRIADVQMHQSFIERLVGVGTIDIQSAGGDEVPEITLKRIRNVRGVKDLVDQRMLESKKAVTLPHTIPAPQESTPQKASFSDRLRMFRKQ
ncbi:MAG: PH domain-containing protein [Candidatus Aenigmarchaeota archaeon]|nr:PH domain-containing protein [Candidatus Aenigmarchaeota archaeon]